MKKVVVVIMLLTVSQSFASEWMTYQVTESLFPQMLKVGSTYQLSSDLTVMRAELDGEVIDMECETAPDEFLRQAQTMRPEISNLLRCDDETMVVLSNNNKLLDYDGIAKMELVK